MAKTNKPGNIVNLYWVTTDDHDEDWFILARTGRAAECYHIEYEGYEPGDARAELIVFERFCTRKKLPAVLSAVGHSYRNHQQLAAPGGTSKLLRTSFI
jgi:hypothetical protein